MWVLVSLICALTLALSDAAAKEAMRRGADDLAAGWLRLLFSAPVLAVLLVVIKWPQVDRTFYLAVAAALPFEFAAYYLYNKALQISPIGITTPFQALTPVFLIGVGYVITGETISSAMGLGGIGLIAAGGYVLNIGRAGGLLGPFRAIGRERGIWMMIGVAALYSVTASLCKVAILHSSGVFFGSAYYIVLAAIYAPLGVAGMRRRGIPAPQVHGRYVWLLVISGVLMAVMCVTNMIAFEMAKVAYVVSVKRTSLLMSVVLGRLVFHEGEFRERILGALMMFAGFVLIVMAP